MSIFRNSKKTGEENPYLNARRSWNDHVAGVMSATRTWQIVGITGMLIGLCSLGGIIYIGSQSKFIPVVVYQDSQHNILAVGQADRIQDAKKEDFQFVVSNFISSIRVITADNELQDKAIFQTFSYLADNDPAHGKAWDFYSATPESHPKLRAAKELVSVSIHSVLQQTSDTWQVDWIETVRNRDGTQKEPPTSMRALLTVYQGQPSTDTTPELILRNPHRIFVRDFNWSKQF